ncbi:MAG: hypothetical protein QXT74_00325 [Candidatus Nezhaarchaeales archaeon]
MKREVARKVIHLSGLSIPLVCLQLDKVALIVLSITCLIISAALEYVRLRHSELFPLKSAFRYLARNNELSSPSGYLYFFLGVSLSVILFEPIVAATALAASILGDAFSAPAGLYFKRFRRGGEGRALEGSLMGALAILILLLVRSFPPPWVIVASATFVIIDFLKPRQIDDNLLFPLTISVVIYLYTLFS